MRVMVTGGAGYIGSVVVEELRRAGHEVVVLDNLSKGHAEALAPDVPLVRADLRDAPAVREALRSRGVEAVVHMAADSLVGESVIDPAKYYENNVVAGVTLLGAMAACGVRRLVFSSTAAVYGEPERQPIVETDRTCPSNPYGASKLAVEQAFPWYARAYGLRATSLRYFNAAGASERCGELHEPETHLIPLVLQAAADPARELEIFGDDYPTPDGTCVRDYIHVVDLARAHALALAAIDETCGVYNLGCGGDGHSVRAVIAAAREVTGRDLRMRVDRRRPGDPAVLVASSARIQAELGWRPERGSLLEIVGSAWRFMRRHPHGYA